MRIELVRATADDVEEYIRIGKLVSSRLDRVATDPDEVSDNIMRHYVFMIHVDGRSVGIISYLFVKATDHAYIDEIAVEPAYQGKGIGNFALVQVLEKLRVASVIELHTHPENPAQRLYERHGFRKTGVTVENWCGTGTPRMQMVLRKNIPSAA